MSVVAAGDDEIAALVALRNRIAALIDDPETPVKDISPLTNRYQAIADRLVQARALAHEEAKAAAAATEADEGDYAFDPNSL